MHSTHCFALYPICNWMMSDVSAIVGIHLIITLMAFLVFNSHFLFDVCKMTRNIVFFQYSLGTFATITSVRNGIWPNDSHSNVTYTLISLVEIFIQKTNALFLFYMIFLNYFTHQMDFKTLNIFSNKTCAAKYEIMNMVQLISWNLVEKL